jgi:DNA invertase Pin-like site-specific DNA recombinase
MTRRRRTIIRSDAVICYTRVSTQEQATSGLGLDAQRSMLERECEVRGWANVVWIEDAGYSAGSLDRPGMQRALTMLTSGEASTLAAAKLDRISRSVIDAASLMELATQAGFAIVALDVGIDTSTAAGRLVANVLASVAAWERDTTRERTRAALAALKAHGVVLGRPRELDNDVRERIVSLRNDRLTYAAIADRLNRECVPTARSGKWNAGTVYKIANAV